MRLVFLLMRPRFVGVYNNNIIVDKVLNQCSIETNDSVVIKNGEWEMIEKSEDEVTEVLAEFLDMGEPNYEQDDAFEVLE